MTERIVPARIAFGEGGTPWSEAYGDIYHPEAGGREQAQHVFLAGNDLPGRWRGRESFTILETGFGLGLNFLEAWHAFRTDRAAPARLHFVSVEKHPLTPDDLATLHARWPAFAVQSRALVEAWPPPVAGVHRLHFEGGRVTLTLALGDAATVLPELEAQADALFLDGFAPAKNPGMWTHEVALELARLAAPGATLATWSVAARVREGLAAAGFEVDVRAGFAHKRDMLAGRKPGARASRPAQRRAVVIGAGIAGTSVAERLAARGWMIEVFEQHDAPARGASGNPSGVLQPVLNLTDAANSRLSRAAFGYALRHLRALEPHGVLWRKPGVLRVARDAAQGERFDRILERLHCPPQLARRVDAREALALARSPVRGGGVWFPDGAWTHPASLCEANLARHAEHIKRRFARRVEAADAFGDALVIDATGLLLPGTGLPLASVRGQVTFLPPSLTRTLDIAVTGEGYITPAPGGGHCVGATFDHDDADREPRLADHAANLAGLEAMLPGFARGLDANLLAGRVGHRVTAPDRVPVFGLHRGRIVATGLGARGLVWAPLCAEILASQLEGEPLPVERSLAAVIAPGRFERGSS